MACTRQRFVQLKGEEGSRTPIPRLTADLLASPSGSAPSQPRIGADSCGLPAQPCSPAACDEAETHPPVSGPLQAGKPDYPRMSSNPLNIQVGFPSTILMPQNHPVLARH